MVKAYDILISVLKEKLGYVIIDDKQEDFAINDYIHNSLTFIQFIVSLEETIGIELSDDFLDNELLSSARGFAEKLDFFMLSQQNDSIVAAK